MADSYRPLREDDPVGTEVHDCSGGVIGTLLACHGESPHRFAWVEMPSSRVPAGPKTFYTDRLFVRVPDPVGELLAATKEALRGVTAWELRLKSAVVLRERLRESRADAARWREIALALAKGEIKYETTYTSEGHRFWVRHGHPERWLEGATPEAALLDWWTARKAVK